MERVLGASQKAALLLASVVLISSGTAHAQTAADKATARKLATEGIEQFQAGEYASALDKLERAEKLYDAPVHLLYIARSQAKVGKLVEATENYRKLTRAKLGDDTSEAVKEAVEQGKRELGELEPKVPLLQVDVTPADASGIELSIDGEKVSSAMVGVERPINPGEHRLVATAEGYQAKEEVVTLEPGSKKKLELSLEPGTGEIAGGKAEAEPAKARPKKVGLLLGLRLFGAIPAGDVGKGTLGAPVAAGVPLESVAMSDVMKAGGGLELQGGLLFARYFGVKGYLDAFGMGAGDWPDNSSVTGFEVGLGAHAGTEPHRFGGFGEVGLGLQSFQLSGHSDATDCDTDITLRALPSFRVGGGAVIPLGKSFHVTPFMVANFATFSESTVKVSCPNSTDNIDRTEKIDSDNRAGHQLFLLGVGLDWLP